MRLIRLELSGFKSFGDKAVINFFQDGVSVIVGPNGCGKSNIVDAIRWTLGEQSAKHLRGASMEDVIFNGSDSRKAVGMAQVTLVFSNTSHDTLLKYAEFSEFSVSRRLYRSGESQYLINKTPCRLTDIRELFMDTGIGGKAYSIIEQGKIDQIITSRAEDRRSIIDEAAGIVKFKSRKKEAERKFALTKQNLLRVEDILAELEKQEVSLKAQVELAEKYLHAKGRLERLKKCSEAVTWFQLKEKVDAISQSRSAIVEQQKSKENAVAAIESKASSTKIEIALLEKKLDDIKTENQRKKEEIINLENQIKTDHLTIANLEEWLVKSYEEIDDSSKQLNVIIKKISTHEKDEQKSKSEIAGKADLLENLKEKEKRQSTLLSDLTSQMESLQKKEIELITNITAAQNQVTQLQERLFEAQEQKERLVGKLSQIEMGKNQLSRSRELLDKKLTEKLNRKQVCFEIVETKNQEIESQNKLIVALNSAIASKTNEFRQSESRFESLREIIESHEEFNSTTKELLDFFGKNRDKAQSLGFKGTLADLFESGEHVSRQSSVFLNRYFNLLVFSSVNALGNIKQLVEELELEQVQICFLDFLNQDIDHVGITLADKVSTTNEQLVQLPMAKLYQLVDQPLHALDIDFLRNANGIIDSSAHLMTKERVFIIGKPGASNPVEFFLNRRTETQTLSQDILKLQAALEKLSTNEEQEQKLRDELTLMLKLTRKEIVDLDLEILGIKKEIEIKQNEISRLANEENTLKTDQKQTGESHEEFDEKLSILSNSITRDQQIQEELKFRIQELKNQIESAKEQQEETSEASQHSRIVLAGLEEKLRNSTRTQKNLREDKDRLTRQIGEIKERAEETLKKRAALECSLQSTNEILPARIEKLSRISENLIQANNELEELKTVLRSQQTSIQDQQGEIEKQKEQNYKLEINLAQLAQEAINIETNLFEEFHVTPEEVLKTFDLKDFNQEAAKRNIASLQKNLSETDNVNLGAKKEYGTLRERLDFLRTQSTDLLESIEALENSIHKINIESRRRFKETFNKINKKFSILFPELFGGGEAYLKLTNDDLLESGIEVIAQPPGKKLQNMTLLSGGEKALTAIALIFAIFQIKPSPFCLLDEVDAPLDDANTGRFNQHVVSMTENSQFIIITHNKKTMEIGDVLFGVTMEEPGISKIVSVDFNKFEESY